MQSRKGFLIVTRSKEFCHAGTMRRQMLELCKNFEMKTDLTANCRCLPVTEHYPTASSFLVPSPPLLSADLRARNALDNVNAILF